MTRTSMFATLTAIGLISMGCNMLTGADGITVSDEEGAKKNGPTGPAAGTGAANGVGGGTGAGSPAGGAGSTGNGGTAGSGSAAGADLVDAQGVAINEIAIYQGVKRPLMQGGSPSSTSVPVVAGRDALVRVFATTDGSYDGSPVTARFIVDGQPAVEVTQALGGAPSDSNLGSTINFQVPGTSLPVGGQYRVELKQDSSASSGANPGASFPTSGFTSLGAQSAGNSLKVVLVPIAYGGDGSNRLPDTSAGQIQGYVDGLFTQYPIPDIELTVRAAVTYNGSVSSGGSGWDSLLNALADLRAQDNVASDVYYYGIFEPASSLQAFCGGGCVSGLGFVGGANSASTRAAIGLGFSGQNSVDTAVHEIGHNHGRSHTPCGGAGGADPSYPYAGGSIGSWGYDLIGGQLISPSSHKDFMGYCNPTWVSDHTFQALFSRLKTVNGAFISYPPELLDQSWERVSIGIDYELTFLDDIELATPPMGEQRTVTAVTSAGTVDIEAQFVPYDHIDGGVLFYRNTTGAPIDAVELEHGGTQLSVVR